GRTADESVTRILAAAAIGVRRIAGMQRKVVRRAGARDQKREGLTPMVSDCAPCRMVVKSSHCAEVSRRDRRLAWPHGEISRQLRPESRLDGKVLASHSHTRISEKAPRQRNV